MFNFSRKDTEYFELFLKNAEYFHLGAVMLDEIIKDPNKSLDRVEEILKLESSSDEVNEKIISKLNLSFITPIDREDIYAIAGELATGVVMLNAALQRIIMYPRRACDREIQRFNCASRRNYSRIGQRLQTYD